ncbi:MAG: hypothetical protein IE931_11395 [Sphingobacteriales bacterium]|nr:hypothetical protein [Sphingobacteriales bacterium]
MSTKEIFHKLIDEIEYETILKGYLRIIQQLNQQQTVKLFKSLTPEEQQELMISYEESFDSKNLVTHQEVKSQHITT